MLPYDILSENHVKPRLFLCEVNKQKICQLETISLSGTFKFNSYSELNFTVPRTLINTITGKADVNPYYNKIEALRLVYLEGFGYFEIQNPEIVSDGIKEVKNVSAYSIEYALSQKYLEDFYVNTGENNSIEVVYAEGEKIEPVSLYNATNQKLSLLHLILEKIYSWKIGHIDESLKSIGKTFEISRVSVYDFIINDICDKFNCFAVFNTIDNTINLYAESLSQKFVCDGKMRTFKLTSPYASIGSVTIDGYKTTSYTYDFNSGVLTLDEVPEDGLIVEITDGSQEQWMTDVYVSFDNLAQEVNISYDADSIKTVLTVKGADDLDIRDVNMGLPYLVDLSYYYSVDWMGQDLYDAYTLYLKNCDSLQDEYKDNAKNIEVIRDYIAYEKNRVALKYSIADNVTSTTVGTYYIRGGTYPDYYYSEAKLPEKWNANTIFYTSSGNDLDSTKFSNLYSALQKYYKSENEKDTNEILKLKDDFKFMDVYTIDYLVTNLNNANTLEKKLTYIMNFLNELWNQIGLNMLNDYHSRYNLLKTNNEESKWNDPSNDNYWLYYPVTIVIDSLNEEIDARKKIIEDYEKQLYDVLSRNSEIANDMLIYNRFTDKQLEILSQFLREDEYVDDNFIKTDIDDIDTILKTKKELMECGRIELQKLCSPKLEFSMDMANIYALPEFEPIVNQFQLGNLINIVIRSDYIKRARLLEVNINFDDFSDFSCEFGELTNLRTPSSIHADLLSTALTSGKSVASNASYWDKTYETVTALSTLVKNGLLDAATTIKSIDGGQGIEIDKYGIHLRKIDPATGLIDKNEGWIVNNQILYSSDNFKTSESVFGEYKINGETMWGVLCKAIMSGYVAGCTIEGGTINIGEGAFVVNSDGTVTMNSSNNVISGYAKDSDLNKLKEQVEKIDFQNIYDVEIIVSGPTIISNSTDESVLTCKVSLWNTDITDTLDSSLFAWKRISYDHDSDEIWNSMPEHHGIKSIIINADDVLENSSFICEVDLPE